MYFASIVGIIQNATFIPAIVVMTILVLIPLTVHGPKKWTLFWFAVSLVMFLLSLFSITLGMGATTCTYFIFGSVAMVVGTVGTIIATALFTFTTLKLRGKTK